MLYTIQNLVYAFHMPLFMMISGFVYAMAYSDSRNVIDRRRVYMRTGNLVMIYVIWSVITGFSKIVLNQFVNRDVSVLDILLIAIRPIATFWYIYVLIFYYLLFSAKLWSHINKWKMLSICIFLCIASNFCHVRWMSLKEFLYYILFFYIGTAYKNDKKWIIGNRSLLLILFVMSIVLGWIYWDRDQKICLNGMPIINATIALGISLAVWYAFEHCERLGENLFLRFLGKYSLEIYVTHNFLTAASRQLPKLGITNIYLSVTIGLAAGIVVPVIFSILCRKMGIHDLFFKPLTYWKKV